jgi:ribosomal protein S18 acetylase RimI-like enzyme
MWTMRELEQGDLEPLRHFTDREIGAGYYSAEELTDIFARSGAAGVMCSLVLINQDGEIGAVRFSYPPGTWDHGKGHGLHPEKWPHAQNQTGYFQSLFIAANLQGQGWGGKLSLASLDRLKKTGAKGVVCHSWMESPNNSSTKYLLKLGFQVVAEHPLYWKDVDYNCTRCLRPPCQCTALEMYLDLEKNPERTA